MLPTTPSRCFLIFNSTEQSFQLIVKFLQTIAEAVHFPQLELFMKLLEAVQDEFRTLILSQLISQIDVWFADEMVQLDLCYQHDVYAQDEVDLSFLQFVDIETEALSIYFYSHDVKNAQRMGFERIEAIEVLGLHIELVSTFPQSTNRDGDEATHQIDIEEAKEEKVTLEAETDDHNGSVAND